MSTWLFTGMVIAMLVNASTIFINRKVALALIPWLVFYIIIVVTYEILTSNVIWGYIMEIAKKYSSWWSYALVILISATLGYFFWRSANIAVKKLETSQLIDKNVLQLSSIGNLKQRANTLSDEIMEDLYMHGWPQRRKRLRNPPFQCWAMEIKCDAKGKPSAFAL